MRLDALFISVDLDNAPFDGRRQNDRRRRNAVWCQAVDHFLEVFDRSNSNLHYERISAGAAVTFKHFIRFLRNLDNVAVIDARYAHSHKCGDRQTDLCRIYIHPIAGDDVSVLEFVNPLDDGRRGQTDAAA